MTVLVIAANNLRRLLRERANLFFVFVLPLLLILVLGLTLGSEQPRIGVHVEGSGSAEAEALIDELERAEGIAVVRFDSIDAATDDLTREDITALVIVPDGYDDALAAGGMTELAYRVIPGSGGFEAQSLVQSAVAEIDTVVRASRVVADQTGLSVVDAAVQVARTSEESGAVAVVAVDPGGDAYVARDTVGFVAAQELVLFSFVIGIVAASALIRSRQLGVTQRMLASPATTFQIITGEALGRYAIAIVQGAFIVGSTALLFGLDWGSWPATAAIIAAFSLVATAAALFVGAFVTNENQATAIGIALGLALAALGGCMVPFEVFPDWLRTAAHITPHAWAIDAFTEVIQRGGGLGQIGLELGVLVLYGGTLLAAASVTLRRTIVG